MRRPRDEGLELVQPEAKRRVGAAGKSEYDRRAELGLLRLEADDKTGFRSKKAATDLEPPEIPNSQRAID